MFSPATRSRGPCLRSSVATLRSTTVDDMNLAGRARQAFAEWSTSHTGFLIDTVIASWSSPKARPGEVLVVVGLEGHQVHPSELAELHRRISHVTRREGIKVTGITVRTLDSAIVITDEESRTSSRSSCPAHDDRNPA